MASLKRRQPLSLNPCSFFLVPALPKQIARVGFEREEYENEMAVRGERLSLSPQSQSDPSPQSNSSSP